MSVDTSHRVEVPAELIEAIQSFPGERDVEHCGQIFQVPALDIYANCPTCGEQLKLRAFTASTELEDVFDAVFEWMRDPVARKSAESRMKTIDSGE